MAAKAIRLREKEHWVRRRRLRRQGRFKSLRDQRPTDDQQRNRAAHLFDRRDTRLVVAVRVGLEDLILEPLAKRLTKSVQ